MKRDVGFDNIRVLLTVLVVFHHVASVYGGAGSWYWKENAAIVPGFVVFNAVNQSFFMGMFFLLAGYFSRGSIEKKSRVGFIKDRLARLGIPLLAYFFIISPLTIALANPVEGLTFPDRVLEVVKSNGFEPGPLWFAEALLIFSILIVFLSKYVPASTPTLLSIPANQYIILISLAAAAVNFFLRMVVPVGDSVLWLQLGYFPMYFLLFYFGYLAYPKRLLSTITAGKMLPWLLVSVLAIIVVKMFISAPFGEGKFEGGFNANAAFYALWEPFCSWGIIFLLLWLFNTYFNRESSVGSFLSRHAYAIYIVHPFFVVLMSIQLAGVQVDIVVKFVLNGVLSFVASTFCAWCLLGVPGFKRVL